MRNSTLYTSIFLSFFLVNKLIYLILICLLLFIAFSFEFLAVLVSALIIIAFYTVLERKLMASIQRRRGPNVVGFWGLLQAIADGLKLVVKEAIIPSKANRVLFILAPIITIVLSLSLFGTIPISAYTFSNLVSSEIDILLVFALSSFGVYGIILSGWSSNSKYAFFGALRSSAQIISYEVFFSLLILSILLMSRSATLTDIVYAQFLTMPYFYVSLPVAVVFFIAILAETNRTPFDLPEAEAEIVAGYNIEYSSILFALFFLGEYGNIFTFSYLFVILFFGGWSVIFGSLLIVILKVLFVAAMFVVVRANLPRYRYDQLMQLGWNCFLPFVFSYFIYLVFINSLI